MDILKWLQKKIINDLYKTWFLSLSELARLYISVVAITAIALVSYIFG